ncbi:serine hydrolase domain-containing protein [Streptomyces sp. 6N223]|uniref:serine hydrolase domain-containing protein n=1 Tax=Streptomyces sp. 6N223 TaxID=3457412 RepID=UPI003FD0321A
MTGTGTGAGEPGQRLAALAAAAPRATAIALATIQGERLHTACLGDCTPHTRFEASSLSKTFTGLLLAEMHARGEVRLTDPITRHLPPHARPRRGRAGDITLLHLATHTSGLPRLPPNLYRSALPRWYTLPYADYTAADLAHAAARIRPRPAPGRRVRYSNFGVGLLGQLLANATGDTYPNLVATRIAAPLVLRDTAVLSATPNAPAAPAALAPGHRRGHPIPSATTYGLPAAGGVCTSAHDMLRFLHAHLRPPAPLARAVAEVLRPRLAHAGHQQTALIWNLRRFPTYSVYFHSGGSRGFTSFAGFSPETGTALAAFANTSTSTLRAPFIQTAYGLLRSLQTEALNARQARQA